MCLFMFWGNDEFRDQFESKIGVEKGKKFQQIFIEYLLYKNVTGPSNVTRRYIIKRNENICLHKKLYTSNYNTIVHSSQKVKTTPNVHQLMSG